MIHQPDDVVITGIGLITAEGVGHAAHAQMLSAKSAPSARVETERFAPYPVHPAPAIDWAGQIPRRGDQRQMENWQRLGVFAAGLALDDAGLKDDPEACASMDMIVAAGGGERDQAVDTLIVDEAKGRDDADVLLNQKLMSELRPTLFLAQLSNLLAGNISIVHKVTGSSRTFMGEEAAGISAIETAAARIAAGQSTHALVGGAYNAERRDIMLTIEGIGACATGTWSPLWSRDEADGGIILGSGAAFLVLESRAYAEARGAAVYATLSGVAGDRGSRAHGGLRTRLHRLADETGATVHENPLIFSGACGLAGITGDERTTLEETFPHGALRGYAGLTGHTVEAAFPIGLALAALALKNGAKVPPFDPAVEKPMQKPADAAIVTAVGHVRGEGLALLSAE